MGQLQRRNAELVDLLSADFINCWIPIQQLVLTSAYSFVAFSDIPQEFRSLVLFGQARSDRDDELDVLRVRFNGDAGNNFNYAQSDFYCPDIIGTHCELAATSIQAGICEGATSEANAYAPFFLLFPGYSKPDRTKYVASHHSGRVGDLSVVGDMRQALAQGYWENLEPVTSIMVYPGVGENFVADCVFELYGVL